MYSNYKIYWCIGFDLQNSWKLGNFTDCFCKMNSISSDCKSLITIDVKKKLKTSRTSVKGTDSIEAKMKKVLQNGQLTFLIFFDSSKLC